jgi:hypothetical protein
VVPSATGYFDWAVSSEGIYYARERPSLEGENYSIQFLDFASGRTTELFQKEGPFLHSSLAISSSEEWILFAEQPMRQAELMLVENFR